MIRKPFLRVGILLLAFLAACGGDPAPTPTHTTAPTANETAIDLPGWQATLAADPQDANAHYRLGLLTLLSEREQAAEHLRQAESLDPTLSPQVTRLEAALRQAGAVEDPAYQATIIGQALASVEEWTLAQEALENAVQIAPDYAEAWAYLGEVRQQTGSGDPLEALNTALRLKPDSYAANLFASMYWKRSDNPARALNYLHTALEQDVNNLALQEDYAQTLLMAGKVEEAFQNIQTLLEADPENPAIWLMLTRLSIENDVQVSQVGLPAARQMLVLEPDNADAALLLGRAYLLTDDPLLAERFFEKATQLAPEMGAPHLYLGILYLNQDKTQSARSQLQEALRLAEAGEEASIAAQARQILGQFFP